MQEYVYRECGLDNVVVKGCTFHIDDAGDDTVTIPNVRDLHRAIASGIVSKPSSLSGRELRFLRTEMGMTQAELAALVHREALAISRWERGEVELIDANAEAMIRLIAKEALGLEIDVTVREIAGFSVPSASTPPLEIDGSDPENYRPLPRAA